MAAEPEQSTEDPEEGPPQLLAELHSEYVLSLEQLRDTYEYWSTEHLRLAGVYWGLCTMNLLGTQDRMNLEDVTNYVLSCQHASGGFGGNIEHDPHITYTLYAVQCLAMCGALDRIDATAVASYVVGLQQPDGSFAGDEWGEIDTRFSYCGLSCLRLLGCLDRADVVKAVDFVLTCRNFDGGFGCTPGAETHAGQVFVCVGALAIAGAIDTLDKDLLGWWCAERQTPTGGLNGRPEKLPDVCYSWWVLSAMAIMRRLDWIDGTALTRFILSAQDPDDGGIADRPEDAADLFHTFFGVAGLSLLGYQGLQPVDPVFALPTALTKRLGVYCGDGQVW